jgi:hypothetical protein
MAASIFVLARELEPSLRQPHQDLRNFMIRALDTVVIFQDKLAKARECFFSKQRSPGQPGKGVLSVGG